MLTLDSLAEAISWDALELPILCLNADDATRICTTIENLADAPHNEPWDVPLLGDHLDLMGPGPHSNDLQWQPRYTCVVCVPPFSVVTHHATPLVISEYPAFILVQQNVRCRRRSW